MFSCKRKVFLKDVDVTKSIYFGAFFNYALEAFELFLEHNKTNLNEFFSKGYLFPVVHAEADYMAPLRVGDNVEIFLSVKSIGNRSITIETTMKNLADGKVAGKVTLVHAFIQKGDEKSSKIPADVIELLTF